MSQLPIPNTSETCQAPIIGLLQQILAAKNSPHVGFDSAQPTPCSLSGVEGDIPRLETEIDRLVYALYDLTEDEIALVEGKG